ncbi:MAG TPA: low molecular weight phosphatase family protein [Methylocella sp.]|nr:low molecular weight phosphatase family protein [Methylocella sp.]
MKIILFLCTGNYYRSRFAEELFNFAAPAECPGWTAISRGIAVDLGVDNVGAVARSAVQALQKHGVNLNPLLARMPMQLKIADLESAHHIVALKQAEHLPLMQERFSSWLRSADSGRIEYWHVDDIDCMAPGEALPLIAREVHGLMKRLSGASQKFKAGPARSN